MRVVHVCAYFAPAFVYGGPPRSIYQLCRAQVAAGLDVEVVTTDANGDGELPADVVARGEYGGVPVTYCRRGWPQQIFRSPALGEVVADKLATADLLHLHGLWNAAIWAAHRAAIATRRPYVLSPRGMLEAPALAHDAWRKRASLLFFERRIISGAAFLHATSEAEQRTLRQRCPGARIVTVPNGVSAADPAGVTDAQMRERLGLPAAAPLILFLGRVHPLKRLDLLAAAFLRVHERYPEAHLVIAGPEETSVRGQVDAMLARVRRCVTWTGAVDDTLKGTLLAGCTALVLCSDSESFGISVAEAMAHGKPVVVTDTLPWGVVGSERAGFVVAQTPQAIGDALNALLEHPDAAARMGERGRALVEARFSWDHAARSLTRAYQDVLRARRA